MHSKHGGGHRGHGGHHGLGFALIPLIPGGRLALLIFVLIMLTGIH